MPMIGFLMAPIYPLINSVMLSSLEKHQHAAMTGLIVVFSALGGTTGSMLTGVVFEKFGGQQAFYGALIPIIGILITLFFFNRQITRYERYTEEV
jgi:FHS family glucose/mannose:H+ symporter-like MFS transporter